MIELNSRIITDGGESILKPEGFINQLMEGNIPLSGENNPLFQEFNSMLKLYDKDYRVELKTPEDESQEFHKSCQSKWFYQTDGLFEILLSKCKDESQITRLCEEWIVFEEYDLVGMLGCLHKVITILREQNILIGVGRGSGVASFVLFLIGAHSINPIKYNLDFNEFLKSKEKPGE